MGDLEKKLASVTASKGHLTRAINRAEDVANRAETNPHSRMDEEINAAAEMLDKRLEKIEEAYSAVIEMDPGNVKTYVEEQDVEAVRQQRTRSRLMTVLGQLQGRLPAQAPAAQALLTPTNEVLKPFVLTKDHTPVELRLWLEKLDTYCTASQMSQKPHAEQIAYLSQCLSPYIYEKIRGAITPALPLHAEDNAPSVVGLIKDEVASRYPLFTRRMEFFRSTQPAGMAFSDWFLELQKLAREADLENINREDITIFRAVIGATDQKLKQKFLSYSKLTLQRLEEIVRDHELSLTAMKSLMPTSAVAATVGQPRRGQDKKKRDRLIREGKCLNCGETAHDRNDCPAIGKTCHNCGKKNHISRTCLAPRYEDPSGNPQPRGRSQSRGRPRFRPPRKSVSRSSSRGSRASSPEHKEVAGHKEGRAGRVSYDHGSARGVNGQNDPSPKLSVWFAPCRSPNDSQTHGCDFRYPCIPDTGATETCIPLRLARRFNLKVDPKLAIHLRGVSGPLKVEGGVRLTLSAGGHETKTVAQVSSSLQDDDILICLQDLKALGVVQEDFPHAQHPGAAKAVKAVKTEAFNDLLREFNDVLKTSKDKFPPMKGGPMTIKLRKDVDIKPHKALTTRMIPLHMQKAANQLIKELIESDVIEKVNEPTQWCHRGFFTPKPGRPNDPRLVVNLVPLNRYVQRPIHPFPSPRDIVKSIQPESRYFAKLDLLHGYFQIELDTASSQLTSFLLPDGVYRFKRAPMGLCSSGDEFCTRTDEALAGLAGVVKLVDDILIQAATQEELLERLRAVFLRCREHQITLAKKKVKVGEEVDFAGFTVAADGVRPDPKLVAGIAEMKAPTNVTELRSFLGLAQQLTLFQPDLAHMTEPLRQLLKKNTAWVWTPDHQESFDLTKKNLTSPLIVKSYDPELPTALLTDASLLRGLGYALVQFDKSNRLRLVQCGSRSLTETESRYATVELECLAILYGVTSARHFLLGCQDPFRVLTDHKPLVGAFKRELSDTTNTRIMRYREKLANYNFVVEWVPGKTHLIADALSRAPVFSPPENHEVEAGQEAAAIHSVTTADPLLQELADDAAKDEEYQALLQAVQQRTSIRDMPETHPARQFKSVWDDLSIYENCLVLYDADRLVVPKLSRKPILKTLHAAHPGINRMRKSAQAIYFWPGMTSDIKNVVDSCEECRTHQPSQAHDTAQPFPKASAPMESVSLDLFELQGRHYLLMVDRYSFFTWVHPLRTLTTSAVTRQLKAWFQTFGLPAIAVSDNGPQFRSEFDEFCRRHFIKPVKSSAYNPESNGLAETAVKQMKRLMKKVGGSFTDFEEALTHWKNTPGDNDRTRSPAEMFFGRRLRTNLPCLTTTPPTDDRTSRTHKDRYDELSPGEHVLVQNPHNKEWDRTAKVIRMRESRRSYDLDIDGRTSSRNRRHLKRIPPRQT